MRKSVMGKEFSEKSVQDFVFELGSNSPVPGGGGASALVGAVGVALGDMVASLTIGKKKYKEYEADLIALKERAESLEEELLSLIQSDADVFEPLSRAYKIGPGEEMENALKDACSVPLTIMERCGEAIDLHSEFAEKGSKLVISDAGAGVIICKAAMQAASLNVYINTSSMTDREYARSAEERADDLLKKYAGRADEIFESVKERL